MRRQHIAYYCNMLSYGRDATEEPMPRIAASLSVGVAGRSQLVHRTRVLRPACPSPSPRIATSLPINVVMHRGQLAATVAHRGEPVHRRRALRPACAPHLRIATSLSIAVAPYRGRPTHRHRALRPTRAQPPCTVASPRTAILERQATSYMKPKRLHKAGTTQRKPRTPQLVWGMRGRRARCPTLRDARESNRARYPGSSHR